MSTTRAGPAATWDPSSRSGRVLGYVALALLAYVPPLLTARGRVAADTKQYLYLEPMRLMGRAVSMWDPNVGAGTVTHQYIGYLFPLGPYYWTLDRLGVPDWVAQRLWLGSLLFAAGAGVLYLLRDFGLRGPGIVVAALAYMLTPYSLDYAARISVLLMPWAALPWMIGLVRKALRDGGWRYPATFALVVQVVGGVNAAALIFAGIGPVLWVAYSWLVAREVPWRRALSVSARIGVLTIAMSAWWIAGLSIQGGYGLNVLRFTETIEAVARTSMPNEILRGLGYWFFYGQDRLGPWIEASGNYTQRPVVILAGYGLAVFALLTAGLLRWRHRGFFVVMLFVGVVIGVGAHPFDSPTPLGAFFKEFARTSTAGLALRSTARAVPLVVLSTAVFVGLGVNVTYRYLAARGRTRWAGAVVVLAVATILVNFPSLVDGTFYGVNLQRPEDIPSYWEDAARALDAGDHRTRVLELPGSDFASYRWGNTVDPITPGLVDRPYLARELVPNGQPASADLLNAVDRRIQEGVFDERGFVAVLRRLGVGTVVARNDIQFERYDLVSTEELARDLARVAELGEPAGYGEPFVAVLAEPHQDERTLSGPANEPPHHPVVLYPVEDPVPIVRAAATERAVILSGDGEGFVDAADVGLLDGASVVRYAASFEDDAARRAAVTDGAVLVVTDSNRRRARRWTSVRDNTGVTEQPGEEPLRVDLGDARLDPFGAIGDDSRTTVDQRGVEQVRATGYGNIITYTPEDRAARAFDGDPRTVWRAGAFGPAIGHRIEAVLDAPITTDHLTLVQPIEGGRERFVTEVVLRFDGHERRVALDGTSRTASGQTVWFPRRTFSTLEVEVANTNLGPRLLHGGADAVGFAEIRVRDEGAAADIRVDEVARLPTDLVDAAGAAAADHALVYVLSRERTLPVPPRHDPEPALARAFEVPGERDFSITGTARLTSDAGHAALAEALGTAGAGGVISTDAREYLQGCVACRADAAIDGDPATAWRTPFVGVRGQWVEYVLDEPVRFDRLDLRVVADGRHSVPTRLRVEADGAVRDVYVPAVADRPQENAAVAVPVAFEPVSGRRIRVTVVDVREAHSYEYSSDNRTLLPAAIAELGIDGVRVAAPESLPATCRADLLTVDGEAVPVRIEGDADDAVAMRALTIVPCDPADPAATPTLRLAAGAHELRAAPGARTGIQLDRVVVASDAGGAPMEVAGGRVTGLPTEPPPAPSVTVVEQGRARLRVRVDRADPGTPFWLVLGQSQSRGWRATVEGRDAGGSELVDGYANGWVIDPASASFDVVLEWTPQRRVRAALAVSVGTALLGIAIVAGAVVRRRSRAALPPAPPGDADVALAWPDRDRMTATPSRGRVAVVASAVGIVGGVVAAPWIGLVAAAAVAVAAARPRARALLALVPALALAIAAVYIVYAQRRFEFPPVFEWPALFPRARSLGWIAVVLLLADAVIEWADRPRAGTPPPG